MSNETDVNQEAMADDWAAALDEQKGAKEAQQQDAKKPSARQSDGQAPQVAPAGSRRSGEGGIPTATST
jgi:hypothetical protein